MCRHLFDVNTYVCQFNVTYLLTCKQTKKTLDQESQTAQMSPSTNSLTLNNDPNTSLGNLITYLSAQYLQSSKCSLKSICKFKKKLFDNFTHNYQ